MKKTYITKDSGKRIKFESGFSRDVQEGKPRFDLIPLDLLTRLADLYTRGAEKYGEENYKLADSPEEYKRFRASAFRHFIQWMQYQDDEDHGIATLWNIFSYEWHVNHKKKK